MEDNPAPPGRTLMDANTFRVNFSYYNVKKTYLCYQVSVQEGNKLPLVEKLRGFLHNQPLHHAELCFLDRVPCWNLDEGKQYRLTWYMSWSPCPYCAPKLVKFLGENSHVSLHIFAARIHTKYRGYENGLRQLRDAGAQLAIMTLKEHQHCWDTFVDNQGQPFRARDELEVHIGAQCQRLENILRV